MEIWKDIPGYEGRYQASDLGRVRSMDRTEPFSSYFLKSGLFRSASLRKFKGKILAPGPSKSGHTSVSLGRHNSQLVHVLVMLTFTGPCPEGHEVLHMNHVANDNRHSNLKYGTRSENIKMDYAVGARKVHPNFNRNGIKYV